METIELQRCSFIFYDSFVKAIERIQDAELRARVYKDIALYGLNRTPPTYNDLTGTDFVLVTAMWDLMLPQLNANWQRYDNGCKGGAPKGKCNNPNGRRGNKPRTNQEQTENKPNDNDNDNLNYKKEDLIEEKKQSQEQVFLDGMKTNYPNVMGMKKPLTLAEYNKLLLQGYTSEQIKAKLSNMDNMVDLKKRYVSTYKTLLNWLRNEHN